MFQRTKKERKRVVKQKCRKVTDHRGTKEKKVLDRPKKGGAHVLFISGTNRLRNNVERWRVEGKPMMER